MGSSGEYAIASASFDRNLWSLSIIYLVFFSQVLFVAGTKKSCYSCLKVKAIAPRQPSTVNFELSTISSLFGEMSGKVTPFRRIPKNIAMLALTLNSQQLLLRRLTKRWSSAIEKTAFCHFLAKNVGKPTLYSAFFNLACPMLF